MVTDAIEVVHGGRACTLLPTNLPFTDRSVSGGPAGHRADRLYRIPQVRSGRDVTHAEADGDCTWCSEQSRHAYLSSTPLTERQSLRGISRANRASCRDSICAQDTRLPTARPPPPCAWNAADSMPALFIARGQHHGADRCGRAVRRDSEAYQRSGRTDGSALAVNGAILCVCPDCMSILCPWSLGPTLDGRQVRLGCR